MTSLTGVRELGSDASTAGIDPTEFARVATASFTGAIAVRTAARRSTVGTLHLDVTPAGGGTTTIECDMTTSGLEATVGLRRGSLVGAGSWVPVAAAMIIGPVELGGSFWPEVPGESVAPVSVVLPTDSVVELTLFFELSTA